ncbi:MAG: hypothetical protein IPP74_06900 [Alphaproteobacteria bacterium]|nr:hypothetical protein [Alphaproteobacteria bacterium]
MSQNAIQKLYPELFNFLGVVGGYAQEGNTDIVNILIDLTKDNEEGNKIWLPRILDEIEHFLLIKPFPEEIILDMTQLENNRFTRKEWLLSVYYIMGLIVSGIFSAYHPSQLKFTSTYPDIEVANEVVNSTIKQHEESIEKWLANSSLAPRLILCYRHNKKTGRIVGSNRQFYDSHCALTLLCRSAEMKVNVRTSHPFMDNLIDEFSEFNTCFPELCLLLYGYIGADTVYGCLAEGYSVGIFFETVAPQTIEKVIKDAHYLLNNRSFPRELIEYLANRAYINIDIKDWLAQLMVFIENINKINKQKLNNMNFI